MNYIYTSSFAPMIMDMIQFRVSLGYSESSYTSELYDFDQFCTKHYPNANCLIEEIVMEWGSRRETEGLNGFKHRLIAVRQFSKYLNFRELDPYIIPIDLIGKYEPFYPYIFTDNELTIFFRTIDTIAPSKRSPFKEYTLPVLFRLAYGCGLRPNEVRDLRKYDVDYKSGTIFIYNLKTKKDRIISITPDLAELCRKYDALSEYSYPNRQWFLQFPIKNSYRRRWISNQLRKYWKESGQLGNPIRYPRVYDFRNYATRILMKWFDAGTDIMVMLPYLSTYMGHVEFQSTAYYIHLLPERLTKNKNFDWYKFESLIPEVKYEEEK